MPKIKDRRFSVREVDNGYMVNISWEREVEQKDAADVLYPTTHYEDKEFVAKDIAEAVQKFNEWANGAEG